ncbi:hypothetical protein PF002_g31070 [Phytophthora fragariae]|uniref:Uncharacterized protein n=1 Tax=Phytophthora fragariae TaxID=53985 RepID=A0A6A3VFN9_9STRA|nr:hypothetical protein PF002_g31070 [Phytophthora fragariae]
MEDIDLEEDTEQFHSKTKSKEEKPPLYAASSTTTTQVKTRWTFVTQRRTSGCSDRDTLIDVII